ncbi:MAG: hypothetical protein MI921_24240 [Cytophagales bacterium]|nr:hypothetical protein [Cytophagales bacterium]
MNNNVQDPIAAMINQMAGKNPKAQMIAQLMAQQARQGTGDPGSIQNDKTKGQTKKLLNINLELKKKIQKLIKEKKQILNYLDFFIDVNAAFSGAVGACECWGGDPDCEKCNGKGEPGYFELDQEQFDYYIKPSLKKHPSLYHLETDGEKVTDTTSA